MAARVVQSSRKSSMREAEAPPEASLYPSLASLQSEEIEDEFSCSACCKKGWSSLFDFTIASCQYLTCLPGRYCGRGEDDTDDSSSDIEDMEVNEMQQRLLFHFKNPFQKWRFNKKRRFPWKLIVQLINIILVTTQLALFANTKFALTNFLQENRKTFVQLFVKDPVAMTTPFTPRPDPIATIYSYNSLLEQINHTAHRYWQLKQVAVGPYGYSWDGTDRLELIVSRYSVGEISPGHRTYRFKGPVVHDNYTIHNVTNGSILDDVPFEEIKGMFDSILKLRLRFEVSSIYVNALSAPYCFLFRIDLDITNDQHSGNMPVSIKSKNTLNDCHRSKSSISGVDRPGYSDRVGLTVLDALVIVFALISIFQCLRSLIKSLYFSRIVRHFFIKKFNYRLKYSHLMPLFNFWFVGVIVSNILVTVGSIMKIVISYLVTSIEVVDITSIFLGLAVFAQWCGILRFLSYFDKYNILLLTLRLALPSVVRFIICTGILYIAFLLCGWLVLGPYHPKFKDPNTASECLFSLVNGDDMFNTYIEMSEISQPAWIFSKIYLYVFISLFIYVVLSVFIGLISDTYETLHEEWGIRSKGLLQDFAAGQLGRAARRSRAYSQASGGGDGEVDEYELIRDIANTPSYGATECQPLIANGGPLLDGRPDVFVTDHSTGSTHSPLMARVGINTGVLPRNFSEHSLHRHRTTSTSGSQT